MWQDIGTARGRVKGRELGGRRRVAVGDTASESEGVDKGRPRRPRRRAHGSEDPRSEHRAESEDHRIAGTQTPCQTVRVSLFALFSVCWGNVTCRLPDGRGLEGPIAYAAASLKTTTPTEGEADEDRTGCP